ncbi:MAG: DNA internalization-related competence protein ComEC/Rec2, partial [Chromatiales bacterium]|nr:DNA internalization-related competence protein ComEC/Rec2 [Chromatiales bacterium]
LLNWLAKLPFVSLSFEQITPIQKALVVVGALLLLLPVGLGTRWSGAVLLVAPLFWSGEYKNDDLLEVTMLDVGQGLSLVLSTRNHTLVYDVGPRYSDKFDAGSGVVAPFLKSRGINRIDKLVLSNGDSDHAGGYRGLLTKITPQQILSGEPERLADPRIDDCISGMNWRWDGVDFQVLSPPDKVTWRGNDASCVLSVNAGGTRILLTGDISRLVESALLAEQPGQLAADVVTVPHHGSSTSSSRPFVTQVKAKYALISAGYRNRYGFPKPEVVDHWQTAGAEVLNTVGSGAMSFTVNRAGELSGPVEYRESHHRYWH